MADEVGSAAMGPGDRGNRPERGAADLPAPAGQEAS